MSTNFVVDGVVPGDSLPDIEEKTGEIDLLFDFEDLDLECGSLEASLGGLEWLDTEPTSPTSPTFDSPQPQAATGLGPHQGAETWQVGQQVGQCVQQQEQEQSWPAWGHQVQGPLAPQPALPFTCKPAASAVQLQPTSPQSASRIPLPSGCQPASTSMQLQPATPLAAASQAPQCMEQWWPQRGAQQGPQQAQRTEVPLSHWCSHLLQRRKELMAAEAAQPAAFSREVPQPTWAMGDPGQALASVPFPSRWPAPQGLTPAAFPQRPDAASATACPQPTPAQLPASLPQAGPQWIWAGAQPGPPPLRVLSHAAIAPAQGGASFQPPYPGAQLIGQPWAGHAAAAAPCCELGESQASPTAVLPLYGQTWYSHALDRREQLAVDVRQHEHILTLAHEAVRLRQEVYSLRRLLHQWCCQSVVTPEQVLEFLASQPP